MEKSIMVHLHVTMWTTDVTSDIYVISVYMNCNVKNCKNYELQHHQCTKQPTAKHKNCLKGHFRLQMFISAKDN